MDVPGAGSALRVDRCSQAPSGQWGPSRPLCCGGSPFDLGCSLNYIERSELPVLKNYVTVAGPLINMVFKLLSKMLGTLKFFAKEALHKMSSGKSRCFSPKIFAIVIFYFSRMDTYSFPISFPKNAPTNTNVQVLLSDCFILLSKFRLCD